MIKISTISTRPGQNSGIYIYINTLINNFKPTQYLPSDLISLNKPSKIVTIQPQWYYQQNEKFQITPPGTPKKWSKEPATYQEQSSDLLKCQMSVSGIVSSRFRIFSVCCWGTKTEILCQF